MAYHHALQPLYEQYVETLYNTVSVYTNDPIELQYVAAARWPGFVRPLINQYEELVQQAEEEGSDPPELEPPATDGRLRLFKFFLPTFTAALDALYPRLNNAADWAADNDYNAGQSSVAANCDGLSNKVKPASGIKVDHLPRMSKFILIAAFVASTNPPKSDLRMFGRGAEERKKRRRKSASPKKGGGAQTIVKVRTGIVYLVMSHSTGVVSIPFLAGLSTVAWSCDISIGQTTRHLGCFTGGKRLRDPTARSAIRTAGRIHGHGSGPGSRLRGCKALSYSCRATSTEIDVADHGADVDAGVAPHECGGQAGWASDVQVWGIVRRCVGARAGSGCSAERLDVGSCLRWIGVIVHQDSVQISS